MENLPTSVLGYLYALYKKAHKLFLSKAHTADSSIPDVTLLPATVILSTARLNEGIHD